MSANPGGGDYVPETDARGMDNQGTELDRLRVQVDSLDAQRSLAIRDAEAAEQRADAFEAALHEEREMAHETIAGLRAHLAERDTLRHQLDPTRGSEAGA
jgi:hypothetical protein